MSSLFNLHQLNLKINEAKIAINPSAVNVFSRWHNLLTTTHKTEEQLQADFLNDIFGEVLGYAYKRGETEINLEKEQKTELDSQKPDGVLGFFTQTSKDIRVIIELKDSKTNLDAKQNRKNDNRTAVEQAFGYVAKYQGIEFVIVSNFNEIRLYQSHYQGKYHKFLMSELASQTAKQQEFYFLLCMHNLIGITANSGSFIKKLINDQAKHETEIQNKFYFAYKDLRKEFVDNLLQQNQITPDVAIAKAQKLFDRLLFIRFCEDNNLINKPFEKVNAGKALGLNLWQALKLLFTSIDRGNPPHIHKFNGGLFACDTLFDSLNFDLKLLEKLINFLCLYHFKNDISVHILGHIFEQSLTDLEVLKANLNSQTHHIKEGKRKQDGIFYTPKHITTYIISETLGGWLKEQKEALQIHTLSPQEFSHNTAKKQANPNLELIKRYKLYAEKLKSIKVLDPACGSGAFLVEVFNYLQNEWLDLSQTLQKLGDNAENGLFSYANLYKDILQNNIFGVDLNSESVQITKLSLWLKTANSRDELTTLDHNIKVGNSLIDNTSFDAKAFDWQKEFPQVFCNSSTEGGFAKGFDVVVGNPPYVRQELFSNLKPALQQKYAVYTGVADLYCYFYEQATNLLKANGKLGFITSNKWMRANYGEPLRKFILANTKIESFVDLGGQEIFKGVGVDANIIVYQKTPAENYQFKTSNNLTDFTIFASNNLDAKCFNIESNNLARQIKTKIEKIGTPLKNWDVKINYGIKTGFNEAFIIDSKTKDQLCLADAKSAEIIKPILRGRDIGRYSTNWAGLWVINTHNGYKSPRSNHPPLEDRSATSPRSNHSPLEGESKLQSNFGGGSKDYITNSNSSFVDSIIYPSQSYFVALALPVLLDKYSFLNLNYLN
jgi:type I restriction-modification system DNA methylase subunit